MALPTAPGFASLRSLGIGSLRISTEKRESSAEDARLDMSAVRPEGLPRIAGPYFHCVAGEETAATLRVQRYGNCCINTLAQS